jgi:hypothetical protein
VSRDVAAITAKLARFTMPAISNVFIVLELIQMGLCESLWKVEEQQQKVYMAPWIKKGSTSPTVLHWSKRAITCVMIQNHTKKAP